MKPNGSKVVYSGGMGAYVALHTLESGATWVVRYHEPGKSWVTVREATEHDKGVIEQAADMTRFIPEEWFNG